MHGERGTAAGPTDENAPWGGATTRRSLLAGLTGIVAASVSPAARAVPVLPDYRITDSEIEISATMPIYRPDTPTPTDPWLLFYIQHSQNPNTIVYTARRGTGSPFDPDQPIDVFWRRFSRQGEREPLTFFERFFVFGPRTWPVGDNNTRYGARLAIYSAARGLLELDEDNRPRIVGKIGDRDVKVVFAYAELGNNAFIPKINFIDIIGVDLASGEYVKRRVRVGF